jgi:hypothetical protein
LDWKASWPENLDKSRVSLAPDILSHTYPEMVLRLPFCVGFIQSLLNQIVPGASHPFSG